MESILEKAKEFEKIYTDEGQSRATHQKKAKVKQRKCRNGITSNHTANPLKRSDQV
ncbi:MAG: hypothetical protein GX625_02555 [Clostridiaceae bacterium]|nr:hypothetical protein [Clostridiaceae bacterium]